jgi:phage N-6-adenine-methyltransferase
MNGQSVVWSSLYSEYQTPVALYATLDLEFRFDLDLAANAINHLAPNWLGPDSWAGNDALIEPWHTHGRVGFVNPPYSRSDKLTCAAWVQKATEEAMRGFTTVALLPVRTDTRWWNSWVMQADEIRTIPHRVHFTVPPDVFEAHNRRRVAQKKKPLAKLSGAGFPSAVVVWRPQRGIIHPNGPSLRTWEYRGL